MTARSIDRQDLHAAMFVLAEINDAALAVEDSSLAEAVELVGNRIQQWLANWSTADALAGVTE